jgi:DNA-binding SARP family transcriptional activator
MTCAALRILMLGQPVLQWEGGDLARHMAAKQQALLYLLAHAQATGGPPLSRSRLAALLWGDQTDVMAHANLRVALSRLRRQVPGVLDVDLRWVGFVAGRIESDLDGLQAALQPGVPTDRRRGAAAAWRGPFLAGFELPGCEDFEQWLALTRRQVAAQAAALAQALMAAHESAGDVESAIGQAHRLLAIDAADESAHMALMRLLARRGERWAALEQYAVCRTALAELLGAHPSAACHALYVRIHADVSGPAQVDGPATAGKVAGAMSVAVSADGSRGGIPGGEGLLGRDRELAQIELRLSDPGCRWLTLYGAPGMGKTALAREAVHRFGGRYRQGVSWIDAGAAVAVSNLGPEALARRAADHLGADGQVHAALLLVLDGLVPQRWTPGCADAVLAALPPGVQVLATARCPLQGQAEWRLEVDGLGCNDAVQLFQRCALRAGVTWDAGASLAGIERLYEHTGGWPLALESASRMLTVLDLPQLLAQLDEVLGMAPGSEPGGGGEQRYPAQARHEAWQALPLAGQAAVDVLTALTEPFGVDQAREAGVRLHHLALLRDHGWLRRSDEGPLCWAAWVRPLTRALAAQRWRQATAGWREPAVAAAARPILLAPMPAVGRLRRRGGLRLIRADPESGAG